MSDTDINLIKRNILEKFAKIEAICVRVLETTQQISICLYILEQECVIYFTLLSNNNEDFNRKIIQAAMTRVSNKEKKISYSQAKEILATKMMARSGLTILTNDKDWKITDIIYNDQQSGPS